MSIRLMTQVWSKKLDHPEQAILLALADRADDDGGSLWPSIGQLAWKTGYAHRSVQRIMQELRERGVIVIVKAGGIKNEARRSNEYQLRIDQLPEKSPYRPMGDRHHDRCQNGTGDILAPVPTTPVSPVPTTPVSPVPVTLGSPYTSVDSSVDPPVEPKDFAATTVAAPPLGKISSQKKNPSTKTKQKKPTDPRVVPTIATFAACYQAARGGQPYATMWGRDGKAIKALSPTYTTEILGGMIAAYFADGATFWAKSRSIAFFVRWLNEEAAAAAFARLQAGGQAVVEDDEAAIDERRWRAEHKRRAENDEKARLYSIEWNRAHGYSDDGKRKIGGNGGGAV